MKRIVGIDLGTTNTLLAWAPADASAPPEVFPIEQLVSASEIERRPLFPSCLYAPLPGEVDGDPFGDAPWVAGEFARRRGAEVDGRLVASAKSWLCHAGVDRTAAILPWGTDDPEVPKISPLDASTRYLAHVTRAYERAYPEAPLSTAEIVLTVPASFDEGARELTLEAATRAGLSVRLLEEPQAAFYDYMRRVGPDGLRELTRRARGGQAHVLVCDVGGGTTDLSLIEVTEGEVARIATGHHLLLGGDNMDITLAHVCEQRFGVKLEPARFAQLVGACRAAKERLLTRDAPEEITVTVLGRGASLLGNTLTTRLTRDEVERIVLDGFFPTAGRDEKPSRKRSGLVAFGLPYERDVAITRHLSWFVARHVPAETPIDAVLFNGGVFRAQRIVERVTEVIAGWEGQERAPTVLSHGDPDLAVARGAVAFGLSLQGHGARIRGGAPHGYYVALADSARRAISIIPRGTSEEVPQIADGVRLVLTVGRPVRFDLFAADDARVDPAGSIVTLDDEHYRALPPAAVTFRAADSDVAELPVVLEGKLTAIGTLELSCVESSPPPAREPRRFRVAFQLRAPMPAPPTPTTVPPVSAGGKRLEEALRVIDRAFGKPRADASARDIKDLVRELERVLGERSSWSIGVARSLVDALVPKAGARRRSADHERIFWMLTGYCLRPGFGDPLDEGRIVRLTPLLQERLAFPEGPRGWQQFFIAWRRVAGGLDETVQSTLRDTYDPFLAPSEAGLKKPKKFKPESLEDLREMLSFLERVPAARRAELGGWLLERTFTDHDPRLFAAIGRLGARVPTYASLHHVVAPSVVERWLEQLLREKWDNLPALAQAAVELSRVTNDRARDVSERTRGAVIKRLTQISAKPEWIRAVSEFVPVAADERAAFFGEGLPVGLRLAEL